MKPIEFEGQNGVLKPQGAPTMTHGSQELPVCPMPILMLDGTCISCWNLTWGERLKAMLTGRVWMGVKIQGGNSAVYVTVDQPFQVERVQKRR